MSSLITILKSVKSVAVVGASPKPGKVGNTILRNIIGFGFRGDVYPVNPKYDEVLGLKAYPNLKALPKPPDAVVIAVPTKAVPSVLREASESGAKLAVIITSGFREVGNEEAERELRRVLKEVRMRVLGPNSAGLTISSIDLHASIEAPPAKGSVGLAMQSGAMGGVVISRLKTLSSGISFFLSLGNMSDIGLSDVFEYALSDEETEALIAYIEWVRNGKSFIELGSRLAKRKPLCILKGGRGGRSSEAVRSHTGGLAGNYAIFKEAVRKIGAYLADDVPDLVEVCEALRRIKSINGRRVLIITNSGGLGVVTASQVEEHGLELPRIKDGLKAKIADEAGKSFTGSNPLDFGGDAEIDQVVKALSVEELRRHYDAAVLVYVPTAAEGPERIASAIKSYIGSSVLPVIGYFDGEGSDKVITAVSKHMVVASTSLNTAKCLKALAGRGSDLRI